MKLEIDFDNKVIKVENKTNLKELIEFIQTLPNWDQFDIDAKTEIVWNPNPIIIERDRFFPYTEPYHWYGAPVTCDTFNMEVGIGETLNGTHQLELIN